MSSHPHAAHAPTTREQRQILDYVGAMSRELSDLAARAGEDSLAGALLQCSEKAGLKPGHALGQTLGSLGAAKS